MENHIQQCLSIFMLLVMEVWNPYNLATDIYINTAWRSEFNKWWMKEWGGHQHRDNILRRIGKTWIKGLGLSFHYLDFGFWMSARISYKQQKEMKRGHSLETMLFQTGLFLQFNWSVHKPANSTLLHNILLHHLH